MILGEKEKVWLLGEKKNYITLHQLKTLRSVNKLNNEYLYKKY